jgi:hypothetical protein
VIPQGLSNAPAMFNRCGTHLLRPVRAFAPSYFDDVFVHSRAMDGKSEVHVRRIHLRKVLTLMRKHKLYANLKKCIFAECPRFFEGIKKSLMESPVLAIADSDRPFHMVCDPSDFAIGCALMQWDSNGTERVIAYQSRQLQAV